MSLVSTEVVYIAARFLQSNSLKDFKRLENGAPVQDDEANSDVNIIKTTCPPVKS
uniref:Uncharacterized protein n=1 Tax=Heterorhabditis bacteriophora TaxID=37862 RepID=A0A1I7XFE2_HETBA